MGCSVLDIPSIEKFKNQLIDIQRTYRYAVFIDLPTKLGGPTDTSFITTLAQSVPLPGKEIETTEYRLNGKTRNMPSYCSYPSIEITFICDTQMRIPKMLHSWSNMICEAGLNYMGYYNDYIGSARIMSLDEAGLPTYVVQLNEFYPVRIDPIQFSSTDKNYATIECQFNLRDWWTVDNFMSMNGTTDIFQSMRLDPVSYVNSLGLEGSIGNDILLRANNSFENLKSGYNFIETKIISNLFAGTLATLLDFQRRSI